MTRKLVLCIPASDPTFGERVRRLVGHHDWDLRSQEGIALLQAIVRETYPSATVVAPTWSDEGRHAIFTIHRDDPVGVARIRCAMGRDDLSPMPVDAAR